MLDFKINHIVPTHLEEEFFCGVRNELTRKKLEDLAKIAQHIPEPQPYGTYQDEAHYAQTLDLVLRSTSETRHTGIFFMRIVLPLLQNKRALLDIGPGNGQLTAWIGNKFQSVTVIDINEKILNSLDVDRATFRKKVRLEKKYSSILDATLTRERYDFALLSHILYYIPHTQWLNVIKRVYESVQCMGAVLIVLSGEKFGKANLIKYFGGAVHGIDSLVQECVETYGVKRVKEFVSTESMVAVDKKTMLHIAGFLLHDAGVRVEKEELEIYLDMHCRQSEKHYEISTQQKYILIHKHDLS